MGSPTSTLRNILRHRLLIISYSIKKCKAGALHSKNCQSNSCWCTATIRAISYSIKNVHLMIPKMNAWILYMHLIDRFLAEIGTFLFQGVAVVSLSLHSPPLWIRVSFMNLLLLYLYSTFYHSIIFFNCQLVQLSFHSAYEHTCTAIIPFCGIISLLSCRQCYACLIFIYGLPALH